MGVMTVNHPAARRFWAKDLSQSVSQFGFFFETGLLKSADDATDGSAVIIRMDRELVDGKGYQVTYDLEGPSFGYPTSGDNLIKGQESKLSLFTDSLQLNQDRKAWVDNGKFSEGLVPHLFRKRVKDRASIYWKHYYDERFIAKLSGSLGSGTWLTIDSTKATSSARNVDGSVASDGNDLRAPSTNRVIYGNSRASQAAITTADSLSMDLIDAVVELAARPSKNTTLNRLLPPLNLGGEECYLLMADVAAIRYLFQNVSQRFYDIQRAMTQGGIPSALWRRVKLEYIHYCGVKVLVVPHHNMVKFSAAASGGQKLARCLLLGAGAARIVKGRGASSLPEYTWSEETDDRGNQLVVATGTTVGIQKAAFNTTETGTTREDWACITLDVYADY